MNRRLLTLLVPPLVLLLVLAFSTALVFAAPAAQAEPTPGATPEAVTDTVDSPLEVGLTLTATEELTPAAPLTEPLRLVVRQSLPLTVTLLPAQFDLLGPFAEALGLTAGEEATDTTAITVAFDLTLDFVVTQTLTSTVPSSVTLSLAGAPTVTLPFSLSLMPITETIVYVEPLTATAGLTETEALTGEEELTETEALTEALAEEEEPVAEEPEVTETPEITETEELTGAAELTETEELTAAEEAEAGEEVTVTLPAVRSFAVVTATATTTANLRTGPATTNEIAGQVAPGDVLEIAALSADGGWYLLADGNWIASFLVQPAPTGVPAATEELINTVVEEAAAGAAPAPAETTAPTTTAPITTTPATTTPVTAGPVTPPTVTVDANLRAGPGTNFAILGGTVTGQQINIIGRNAAGDWFILDNGGWVSAALVANPPALATVAVVADTATPATIASGEAVITPATAAPAPASAEAPAEGPLLVPTPTPAAPGEAATSPAAEDQLYLDSVTTQINRYNLATVAINRLLREASEDATQIQTPQWQDELGAAVNLLRTTSTEIRGLTAPPIFAQAHIDLRSAASAYDLAADRLDAAVAEADQARFAEAQAEIDFGASLVERAQERIDAAQQSLQ